MTTDEEIFVCHICKHEHAYYGCPECMRSESGWCELSQEDIIIHKIEQAKKLAREDVLGKLNEPCKIHTNACMDCLGCFQKECVKLNKQLFEKEKEIQTLLAKQKRLENALIKLSTCPHENYCLRCKAIVDGVFPAEGERTEKALQEK